MVEAIAELDEDLMMKYLDGEELSQEELKAALRKGVINNEIVPVICGSSYKKQRCSNDDRCGYRLYAVTT